MQKKRENKQIFHRTSLHHPETRTQFQKTLNFSQGLTTVNQTYQNQSVQLINNHKQFWELPPKNLATKKAID